MSATAADAIPPGSPSPEPGPLAWVLDEVERALDAVLAAVQGYVAANERSRAGDLATVDASELRWQVQALQQVLGVLDMVGCPAEARTVGALQAVLQRLIERPLVADGSLVPLVEGGVWALLDALHRRLAQRAVPPLALFPCYRDWQQWLGGRAHPADVWVAELPATLPALPSGPAYAPGPRTRHHFERLVLPLLREARPSAAAALVRLAQGLARAATEEVPRRLWVVMAAACEAVAVQRLPLDVWFKRALASTVPSAASAVGDAAAQARCDGVAREWLYLAARIDPAPDASLPVAAALWAVLGWTEPLRWDPEQRVLGQYDPRALRQAVAALDALQRAWESVPADGGMASGGLASVEALALALERLPPPLPALGAAWRQWAPRGGDPLDEQGVWVALGLQAELQAYDPLDPQQGQRLQALAQRLQARVQGRDPGPTEPWLAERYRAWSERQGGRQWANQWRQELAAVASRLDTAWRTARGERLAPARLPETVRDLPARLRELQASADVMGLTAAAQALAAVASTVQGWCERGTVPADPPHDAEAARLADTLTALDALVQAWAHDPAAARAYAFDAQTGVLRPPAAVAAAERAPYQLTPTEAPTPAAPSAGEEASDLEVFRAEALDWLAAVPPLLQTLAQAASDATALARLRRLFHSLKGSARLVGLEALGAAAWEVERRLNALLADGAALPASTHAALVALTPLLRQWVEQLDPRAADGADPADWAARVAACWSAADGVSPVAEAPPFAAATVPAPDSGTEAAEEGVSTTAAAAAPLTIGPLVVDPELFAVFLDEADAHSQQLEAQLGAWQTGASVDLDAAADSAHTLAGQCATIGHTELAALARALEEALRRAHSVAEVPLVERALPARAAQELRALLHQLAGGCYRAPASATLDALAHWPPSSFTAVASAPDRLPAQPMPSVPTSLDRESDDVPALGAPQASAAAMAGVPQEDALADFRQEADALLPPLQAAQARWAAGEPTARAELLRLLHTAKGSARLAGQHALADGAHALESALVALPDGIPPPDVQRDLARWLEALAPPPEPALTVPVERLDRWIAAAAQQMALRQRRTQTLARLRRALGEMDATVQRLRQQWRELQRHTERPAASPVGAERTPGFDPLELERYTRVQELTRLLAETVEDVAALQRQLDRGVADAEDQAASEDRLTRQSQRDLLQARWVPFASAADRLARALAQAADAHGRRVAWRLEGGEATLDRALLEHLVPLLDHLLRNAVVHGIEAPETRVARGKPAEGQVVLEVRPQGQTVSLTLRDDGAGLDLEAVRAQAVAHGLHDPTQPFGWSDALRCVLAPGISTAAQVDAWAGRGIGLDAVRAGVEALGGRIEGFVPPAGGLGWRLVVPLTTAVVAMVRVRVDGRVVGLPLPWVHAVRRVRGAEWMAAEVSGVWHEGGRRMPLYWLGALLGTSPRGAPVAEGDAVTLLECHSAGTQAALRVDAVLGRDTAVLRALPPPLAAQPALLGAHLQPDGEALLVYQPMALVATYGEGARRWADAAVAAAARPAEPPRAPLVLVVDDSVTVRRVTQRLLVRAGFRVALAADGLQALERLRQETPVVVLCDIEMPRMDGFELVRAVRNDPRWSDLPVVMITSRLADKHRAYARSLGVDHYLGKPYAEEELLALVSAYARLAPPASRPAGAV